MAGSGVGAFGATDEIGGEVPPVWRGPRDVSTSGAILDARIGKVSPRRRAAVASGVDWQEKGVVVELGSGGAGEAAAFESKHGVSDVNGEGVGPKW